MCAQLASRKKGYFLSALGPLRPLSKQPRLKTKFIKFFQSFNFLNDLEISILASWPIPPPPLLEARPLKNIIFFAASLTKL